MRRTLNVLFAAALVATCTSAATAQADAWQRKWYWGGQGGVVFFQDGNGTNKTAAQFGGHWLITGKRSALFIGVDQINYSNPTQAFLSDGTEVDFSSGRRLEAGLYAIPSDNKLQIMLGGGFAINQITDAQALGPFATPQAQLTTADAVDGFSTKASAVLAAGIQLRFGNWALFGHYEYMPAAKDFLITSGMQSLTFGLRLAVSSAHEDVTTGN